MKDIQFKITGYENFSDYIKAYAIVCVLIRHIIPATSNWYSGLWVDMQVPLFVLVQSFHSLKKPVANLNWLKLFYRIIVPYFMVQAAIILLLGIKIGFNIALILNLISGWVYFQRIIQKVNK